jgi:exonuclease SbcD
MKFCYITDIHFRETTPINRTDIDIIKSLERKFEKLKTLCKQNNVDFIVHGGDLGHNWDWKLSLLNRVDKLIKNLGIPFYSIIGNHDVPGKNILEFPNTGLAFLEKLGSVKILHPKKTTIGDWNFYGFHSDTKECDEFLEGTFKMGTRDNLFDVAIVHAPVGKTGLGHEIHYKQLKVKNFDLAFFGDIHSGFPLFKLKSGTTVGNPGSFFRQSLTESNQPVSCYIVEKDKVELVEIEPKNKSLFKIKQKVSKLFKGTESISKLSQTKQKVSDYKLLSKLAKDMGIPISDLDKYYDEFRNC